MACKHEVGREYCNQSNPQFIGHKHNGGVGLVNTELVPKNVLKDKEEWFYQWANNYNVWNSDSYLPTKGIEMANSHTFTSETDVFNLIKTKHNRKSRIRIVNGISTSNKTDFYIGKRQS